jgi:phenylpropionate dioxygenase-like ring-hydroxylating dioxygenase large terminal subunit
VDPYGRFQEERPWMCCGFVRSPLWCHASAGHAVTTRLAQVSAERTEMVATWLVDKAPVEGRDYSLDTMLATWARTSEPDWALCEHIQRGIKSPEYRPARLSGRHGANVAAFHASYRETIVAEPRP